MKHSFFSVSQGSGDYGSGDGERRQMGGSVKVCMSFVDVLYEHTRVIYSL